MKKVCVTGASRGLGISVTEKLLADGYEVIAISRSITDELRSLTVKYGGQLTLEKFDLANIDEIPDFARRILKEKGQIFGLVNNAGIGNDGVLATMHQSDIEGLIKTNLTAPIMLSKYFIRPMLRKKSGRIINIGSIIGSTGYHGLSVYGATKAGLEGFTRSLSREAGKANVTVNCVAPGYMETAMTAGLQGDKLESVRRRAPLGLPRPDQVANLIVFLMSEEAAAITGTVMTADGGATA